MNFKARMAFARLETMLVLRLHAEILKNRRNMRSEIDCDIQRNWKTTASIREETGETEVVCVRNYLICVRWANPSLRKGKRE